MELIILTNCRMKLWSATWHGWTQVVVVYHTIAIILSHYVIHIYDYRNVSCRLEGMEGIASWVASGNSKTLFFNVWWTSPCFLLCTLLLEHMNESFLHILLHKDLVKCPIINFPSINPFMYCFIYWSKDSSFGFHPSLCLF